MRYKFFIIASLLIIAISSCNKIVELDPPKNQLLRSTVFTRDALVVAATLNLYTSFTPESFISFNALYTDELINPQANSTTPPYVASWIPTNNTANYNMWKAMYAVIYQANDLLDGLQNNPAISETVSQRARGEAYFMRALSYLYLVNIWGDVPQVISSQIAGTVQTARTPVATIYAFILQDLAAALPLLQNTYAGEMNARASACAVHALLARVHLYLGEWGKAESSATDAIACKGTVVLPAPAATFLASSNETILQIWNQNGFTSVGSVFIPASTSANPAYGVRPSLLNAYEIGDLRRSTWFRPQASHTIPFKYKARTLQTGATAEYLILLRLAEVYLIRAEARLNQSNTEDAIGDLEKIRQRAGFAPLTGSPTADDLYLLMQEERRRELFAEGAHRFFDLKRWGTLHTSMRLAKPDWKEAAQLYPIPFGEILINPSLTQNPDYQ